MSVTVTVPDVTAATIAPNPANINQTTLLTVTVTETQVVLDEIFPRCGQALTFCNEVIFYGN